MNSSPPMTYTGVGSLTNLSSPPVVGEVRTDNLTGELFYYDGSQWILISSGLAELTKETRLKSECDELVAGMNIADAVYALRMMRRLLDEPENELIQREYQNLRIALKMTKE